MADMNEKFKIIFFIVMLVLAAIYIRWVNKYFYIQKKINVLIFTLIFNLFSWKNDSMFIFIKWNIFCWIIV